MKNVNTLLMGALVVTSLVSCIDDSVDDTPPSVDFRAELYVTSNDDTAPTQGGNIEVFNLINNAASKTLVTASTSAEGIYYDPVDDEVTQASRSALQLNSYANVSTSVDGITLDLGLSSSTDLSSPRDIAVNGNTYVVSDNGDDTFFVYTKTDSGFELQNTFDIQFNVWGIEFIGNDLYAVVDSTSDVAVFSNFTLNTTDGLLNADATVTFEGIVRSHGLAYDGTTMILTDIGEADDDSDGGFQVITNFINKFNTAGDGGSVAITEQSRVAGASTFLGNPVSVDYDAQSDIVFIAERANSGGRVLAFDNITRIIGNVIPNLNIPLSGASSVYLYIE